MNSKETLLYVADVWKDGPLDVIDKCIGPFVKSHFAITSKYDEWRMEMAFYGQYIAIIRRGRMSYVNIDDWTDEHETPHMTEVPVNIDFGYVEFHKNYKKYLPDDLLPDVWEYDDDCDYHLNHAVWCDIRYGPHESVDMKFCNNEKKPIEQYLLRYDKSHINLKYAYGPREGNRLVFYDPDTGSTNFIQFVFPR